VDLVILIGYCNAIVFILPDLLFTDNLGEDCPVFENLFEFCQIYAGGTIGK
jgi:hypothetical protein